jgi:hypothetical protein
MSGIVGLASDVTNGRSSVLPWEWCHTRACLADCGLIPWVVAWWLWAHSLGGGAEDVPDSKAQPGCRGSLDHIILAATVFIDSPLVSELGLALTECYGWQTRLPLILAKQQSGVCRRKTQCHLFHEGLSLTVHRHSVQLPARCGTQW